MRCRGVRTHTRCPPALTCAQGCWSLSGPFARRCCSRQGTRQVTLRARAAWLGDRAGRGGMQLSPRLLSAGGMHSRFSPPAAPARGASAPLCASLHSPTNMSTRTAQHARTRARARAHARTHARNDTTRRGALQMGYRIPMLDHMCSVAKDKLQDSQARATVALAHELQDMARVSVQEEARALLPSLAC